MPFLRSLSSGVTGLQTTTTMMDIIGNNVANINTTGYKASRVTFGEMFSQTLRGATGATDTSGGTDPLQVGLGTSVESIDTLFSQGAIESTGNSNDLAIEGDGFFVVKNGGKTQYTRVGALALDSSNNLTMAGIGAILQGKMANDQGVIPAGATLTNIQVDQSKTSPPKATTSVNMGGNVDASAATYVPASAGPPPVAESGGKASTTMNVYDSLGNTHALTVTMTKNATANTWDYSITDSSNTQVASGSVTFNADGTLATGSPVVIPSITLTNGAAPLNVTVDMSAMTQTQGTGSITPEKVDGYASGQMSSWSVDENGYINATFSNGQVMKLGQVMVAEFNNPEGLTQTGSGIYDVSPNSGIPELISPGGDTRSKILSGSLEQSNVDLPTEFTKMIVAQRGFQANARVITTSDEILQELVNLKR